MRLMIDMHGKIVEPFTFAGMYLAPVDRSKLIQEIIAKNLATSIEVIELLSFLDSADP